MRRGQVLDGLLKTLDCRLVIQFAHSIEAAVEPHPVLRSRLLRLRPVPDGLPNIAVEARWITHKRRPDTCLHDIQTDSDGAGARVALRQWCLQGGASGSCGCP